MNPNYEALLTLIGDVNNTFAHVEDEDSAAICDGDIKLLDKAVKRFKLKLHLQRLEDLDSLINCAHRVQLHAGYSEVVLRSFFFFFFSSAIFSVALSLLDFLASRRVFFFNLRTSASFPLDSSSLDLVFLRCSCSFSMVAIIICASI